jgi:hypothetical protein
MIFFSLYYETLTQKFSAKKLRNMQYETSLTPTLILQNHTESGIHDEVHSDFHSTQ